MIKIAFNIYMNKNFILINLIKKKNKKISEFKKKKFEKKILGKIGNIFLKKIIKRLFFQKIALFSKKKKFKKKNFEKKINHEQ